MPRKCFHCEYFCLNRRDEKSRNFLVHNQMGGRQPIEDNPFKKMFFDENLQRYCINFYEHGDYYDFYDSRELVSDFWLCLKMFFLHDLILDGFPSSVHLRL